MYSIHNAQNARNAFGFKGTPAQELAKTAQNLPSNRDLPRQLGTGYGRSSGYGRTQSYVELRKNGYARG